MRQTQDASIVRSALQKWSVWWSTAQGIMHASWTWNVIPSARQRCCVTAWLVSSTCYMGALDKCRCNQFSAAVSSQCWGRCWRWLAVLAGNGLLCMAWQQHKPRGHCHCAHGSGRWPPIQYFAVTVTVEQAGLHTPCVCAVALPGRGGTTDPSLVAVAMLADCIWCCHSCLLYMYRRSAAFCQRLDRNSFVCSRLDRFLCSCSGSDNLPCAVQNWHLVLLWQYLFSILGVQCTTL